MTSIKVVFLALVILLFAVEAFSSGTLLNGAEIEYLTITESVAYFQAKGVETNNPDACTQNEKILVATDHPRFKEVYATLLAAQTGGKLVKVFGSDCLERWEGTYPKLVTLHLLN